MARTVRALPPELLRKSNINYWQPRGLVTREQLLTGENHIQTIPKSGYRLTDFRKFIIRSKPIQAQYNFTPLLRYSAVATLCLSVLIAFSEASTKTPTLTLQEISLDYNNEVKKAKHSQLLKENGWQVDED